MVHEGLILLFHQTFNFISIKEMERQCLSLRLSLLCLLRNSFQLSVNNRGQHKFTKKKTEKEQTNCCILCDLQNRRWILRLFIIHESTTHTKVPNIPIPIAELSSFWRNDIKKCTRLGTHVKVLTKSKFLKWMLPFACVTLRHFPVNFPWLTQAFGFLLPPVPLFHPHVTAFL